MRFLVAKTGLPQFVLGNPPYKYWLKLKQHISPPFEVLNQARHFMHMQPHYYRMRQVEPCHRTRDIDKAKENDLLRACIFQIPKSEFSTVTTWSRWPNPGYSQETHFLFQLFIASFSSALIDLSDKCPSMGNSSKVIFNVKLAIIKICVFHNSEGHMCVCYYRISIAISYLD